MGSSSTAKQPAKQVATSPATDAATSGTSKGSLLHQEWVNSVCLSFFDDNRFSFQRRYRKPNGGEAGYADSLRLEHLRDAQAAIDRMIDWLGENQVDQSVTK